MAKRSWKTTFLVPSFVVDAYNGSAEWSLMLVLCCLWHGMAGLLFAKSCAGVCAGAVWLHFVFGFC